jgi:hypothetical protein
VLVLFDWPAAQCHDQHSGALPKGDQRVYIALAARVETRDPEWRVGEAGPCSHLRQEGIHCVRKDVFRLLDR